MSIFERLTVSFLFVFLIFGAISVFGNNSRRFSIDNLGDPKQAEVNAYAINEDLQDLYIFKVDIDTQSTDNRPEFTIHDLDNKDLGVENAAAFNADIDNLWLSKQNVSGSLGQRQFQLEDLSDSQKAEENAFMIESDLDDLWRDKLDR